MSIKKESVKALVDLLDGHSIFRCSSLIELGLPVSAVDDLIEEHISQPDMVGGGIYDDDDEPLESLTGIYGLDALHWLAKQVGADTKSCVAFGRGTRADQYKTAILAAIE